jgi:hypothetical protein
MNVTAQTSRKVVPTTDAIVAAMLASGEFQIKPISQKECAVWRHGTQLGPLDSRCGFAKRAQRSASFMNQSLAAAGLHICLRRSSASELRLSPIKHGFSVEGV